MRAQFIVGLICAVGATALRVSHPSIYQLRKQAEERTARSLTKRDDVDPTLLYPAYNLSIPIDHFQNETRYEPHSSGNFNLSYWFDTTYYKSAIDFGLWFLKRAFGGPGGPVFVLLSGETYGTERLPYLQKGIVHQVIEATNGLGVIMEHRYYGTSFPTPDLSTENLRFLSTEQALADVDYFARNVKFEGIDADLTAPNTAWIAYGGSYAGAQAAFLRVEYPNTFWGTVSSSGVTAAIYDYWQYFEPIRQFAPPDIVSATQTLVDVVDKVFAKNDSSSSETLKAAFGLGNITDNRDFANVLTGGIFWWQSTNWDPAVNDPDFWYYQNNLSSPSVNYEGTESQRSTVQSLLQLTGYGNDTATENIILNAIGYFNVTSVAAWDASGDSQDEYFSQLNASNYQAIDYDAQVWRSWDYQVCTEWGFIQTGNTPANIKPLISRLLDIEYLTFFCRAAFNITTPPNTDRVNKYGNFSIEYPRLAIIGGNADPWRPSTPLADSAPKRNSTSEEPVLEIAHAVHHWDENGLFANETTPILPPNQIVFAQQFIKDFVVEWLKDWDAKSTHYEL